MSILRLCLIKEHADSVISHLCLHKGCQMESRWTCKICLEKEFHKHRQQNNDHLMNKQQLVEFLSIQKIDVDDLIQQIKKDCFAINRQQINRIINLNSQKQVQNQNYSQKTLQGDQNLLQLIEQSEKIISQNEINEQDINYSLCCEYEIKQDKSIQALQISPNDNFLAFGFDTQLLIFDLRTKQKIQSVKLKQYLTFSHFSEDSKYLYCGNRYGQLICFKANQNFRLFFQQQICMPFFHYQLIFINPSIALSLFAKKITIINLKIKKSQQIVKQVGQGINLWSYEYSQKFQILIFTWRVNFQDTFIKFIKIPTLQVIMEQKIEGTCRMQLISDNKLISIGSNLDHKLYLWHIDYQQKQVTLIKYFECKEYIKIFKILINFINNSQSLYMF